MKSNDEMSMRSYLRSMATTIICCLISQHSGHPSQAFPMRSPSLTTLQRSKQLQQERKSDFCAQQYTRTCKCRAESCFRRQSQLCLKMALVPLMIDEMERLISTTGKPTGAQYATYWGRTKKEKYGRFIESATVSFLGVFFSYFMSFVVGGFVATILGCLFFFWGVLSPELKAYQRNWEFLGGRDIVDRETVQRKGLDPDHAGLYGGLFLGYVADVCVVEDARDDATAEYDLSDFSDYTMESDELDRFTGQPYLLRVQLADSKGRKLQVHCRLTEDYLDLRPGMLATSMLLSTTPRFTKLAALTDVFVLDGEGEQGVWIGDYPYLNRPELESILAEDDELWEKLQNEAIHFSETSEQFRRKNNVGRTKQVTANERTGEDYGRYYDDDEDYGLESENRERIMVPRRNRAR